MCWASVCPCPICLMRERYLSSSSLSSARWEASTADWWGERRKVKPCCYANSGVCQCTWETVIGIFIRLETTLDHSLFCNSIAFSLRIWGLPRSQVPVQLSVLVVWQSGLLHVTRKLGRGLETRLRVATLHTVSLVPRPLPDFISQPWRKIHGCAIKSGSGLGTRLKDPHNYTPRCNSKDPRNIYKYISHPKMQLKGPT